MAWSKSSKQRKAATRRRASYRTTPRHGWMTEIPSLREWVRHSSATAIIASADGRRHKTIFVPVTATPGEIESFAESLLGPGAHVTVSTPTRT